MRLRRPGEGGHHHRKSHSQALRPLGSERLYQALIAMPEHAGHAVPDNRRRESCAELRVAPRVKIRTRTVWFVPIRLRLSHVPTMAWTRGDGLHAGAWATKSSK